MVIDVFAISVQTEMLLSIEQHKLISFTKIYMQLNIICMTLYLCLHLLVIHCLKLVFQGFALQCTKFFTKLCIFFICNFISS